VLAACPVDDRPPGAPRLTGQLKITLHQDSMAYRIYGRPAVAETFTCNYELNPDYREELEKAGMRISGIGSDGGARIVELCDRAFFIGTGFLPQLSSEPNRPHPLVVAFLKAALENR
jgi:CTP synthase